MAVPSRVRLSSFGFFPENSQAFSTKLSTVSDVRLSTHFGLLSKPEEAKTFLVYPDLDKRHSTPYERNYCNIKVVDTKNNILPIYGHWAGRKFKKPMQTFCTGSRYVGEWNALGFCGEGVYRYPHGAIYEGEFSQNGLFHGIGTLTYPNGQKIQGIWKNGELTEDSTFIFACGEVLDEDFRYCQRPDRRFHVEIQKELGPAGQEYLTNDQPTKKLPQGCYDVGEGLYDPKIGCIMSFPKSYAGSNTSMKKSHKFVSPVTFNLDDYKEKQLREISSKSNVTSETMMMSTSLGYDDDQYYEVNGRRFLEIPTAPKVAWIKENCRKAWDENIGYCPELYEKWMAGRRYEVFLQDKHEVFYQDRHDSLFEGDPKWLTNGEKRRAEDSQSAKFVRFVQKNAIVYDKSDRSDRSERLKSIRTSPMRHDNRQKFYERGYPERSKNLGNGYYK
ncbi:unnamed protein product [Phaedon cochleariae]|uniref:MORN repeat-containing protein 5 n=1 Tax=Phaedon cochleariae TaxID=80249 RepID=A0A9P0DRP3_PHACE|nr:unnamed protein product [Phaedon cochleariae]